MTQSNRGNTKMALFWKKASNFQFNTVRAENEFSIEFSIEFMSFWLTFSLGIILLLIVKYDRLGESNLKRFVVVASDWPKNKSSESSEQLFTSWTLQLWFVKVISQFYSKVVVRLKWRSSVDYSRQFWSVGNVSLCCLLHWRPSLFLQVV